MSSMDIDSLEEKKNSQTMPSAVSNEPRRSLSKMKETKPDTATDDVATGGRKEKRANNSGDDSSLLSDVPSPVLSRASVSAVNARRHVDPATEKEGAMPIVASVEPKKQEDAEVPSKKEEEKQDEELPDAPSHLSPSDAPANIDLEKAQTAAEAFEQEATNDASKADKSLSPSSPPAPLLTPGTGADSSNRAQSPATAPESETEKLQEPEKLSEPQNFPEPEKRPSPEPEPVVELTADEKEALMALNAMLSTVAPAVARAAVREHASKCLLGFGPDETAFLDAIFTAASDQVAKKFIDANGGRIIDVANQQCKSFLDRALKIRLKDIDGTSLVRYLARADRLGFEEQDQIDGESVMPIPRNVQVISSDPSGVGDHQMQPMYGMSHASGAMVQQHWPAPPPGMMYDPAVYSQPGFPQGAQMKHCPKCGAGFKQNAGLKYHIEHDVCKKAGTPMGPVMARCESCGKEFRSPGGYHYHITNKVCNQPAKESSPQPEGQASADSSASHPVSSAGQQPRAKDDGDRSAPPPQTPASIASHPPLPSGVPHMFQNSPQQPYQGPYQNPPLQHHYQQQPPPPAQVLPSHGLAMPTAASGERIGNANGLLTPEQAHKLNEDLKAEDRKYAAQLENLDPSLEGQAREIEIKRLKAGMSTRKSNLRRKHGIFVRKTDKTAANAVRNEDGSIDLAPAGKTVSIGSGFAPINGPSASASPAPQNASRGPESPAAGEPDPKRRRVSDYPPQSPYPQPGPVGPTGYPPNYNMHPGSYDPRQQHHIPQGTYQQYGMSPYTQQSPYSQHPPVHQPYGPPPPGYQMNTIIRAPGAPPPDQSPGMPLQGPPGPGYFPPQGGFVAVNGSQPPAPTPPPGYMTIVSPAPQPHPPVVNGQEHGAPPPPPPPPQSSTSASPRGSSAAPVENGVSKPKVPTDNAEKVWKAKQKERDWVVQTGPQHAFTRMGKESSSEKDGKKHDEKKQDGKKKPAETKQRKPANEFHVPTDDEATDEDESARRPYNLDGTAEEPSMVRRASSASSELSDLDDSAILGAGEGGEPYLVAQASDSASEAAKKPADKKQRHLNLRPEQSRPVLPSSGFMAINMPHSHVENLEDRENDSEELGNLRPQFEMKAKKAKQAREASMRAVASASCPQQIDGNEDNLEPDYEILQVASEDEMQIDTPPLQRRRQASGGSPPSGSAPPLSSAAGTPTASGQPSQPKKRLGRPVGWKKGMGGYRELLDKGVVHHNEEGTPASRRRAEKRAAERLRRQTEGDQGGLGGGEAPAQGAKSAAGRKSVG